MSLHKIDCTLFNVPLEHISFVWRRPIDGDTVVKNDQSELSIKSLPITPYKAQFTVKNRLFLLLNGTKEEQRNAYIISKEYLNYSSLNVD